MNKYKIYSTIAVYTRLKKSFDKFKITTPYNEEAIPTNSIKYAVSYIFKPRSKFFHFDLHKDCRYLLIKKYGNQKNQGKRKTLQTCDINSFNFHKKRHFKIYENDTFTNIYLHLKVIIVILIRSNVLST